MSWKTLDSHKCGSSEGWKKHEKSGKSLFSECVARQGPVKGNSVVGNIYIYRRARPTDPLFTQNNRPHTQFTPRRINWIFSPWSCFYGFNFVSNGADIINDSKHMFIRSDIFYVYYQAFLAEFCDLQLFSFLYSEMLYEERPTSTLSTTATTTTTTTP